MLVGVCQNDACSMSASSVVIINFYFRLEIICSILSVFCFDFFTCCCKFFLFFVVVFPPEMTCRALRMVVLHNCGHIELLLLVT